MTTTVPHGPQRSRARALCAWLGQKELAPVGACPASTPLSEGFDRRATMLVPTGGNCHPLIAAHQPLTYLYFNQATRLGESGHHATFYPILVSDTGRRVHSFKRTG